MRRLIVCVAATCLFLNLVPFRSGENPGIPSVREQAGGMSSVPGLHTACAAPAQLVFDLLAESFPSVVSLTIPKKTKDEGTRSSDSVSRAAGAVVAAARSGSTTSSSSNGAFNAGAVCPARTIETCLPVRPPGGGSVLLMFMLLFLVVLSRSNLPALRVLRRAYRFFLRIRPDHDVIGFFISNPGKTGCLLPGYRLTV